MNPVVAGMSPDPSICRHGDQYVLVTSSMEYFPGLPLHLSDDGEHFEPIGHVIDRPGQVDLDGCADSFGLWAPTIRHHDGVWYVAATLMLDGSDPGRSFYATATDPRGAWSDPVWLDDASGIDPSLFFHEGRVWWHASRHPARPEWPDQREIWLRELDLAAGALVGPERVIWNGALRGARWTEAPHLYRRDGRFILVTAEGGTGRAHAVVVARSETLSGPYESFEHNPVLTHRHLGERHPVQNVGHADLVTRPDGSWWAVALAASTHEGHNLLGRETVAVEVDWERGWPVFAPGEGKVRVDLVPPREIGETVTTLHGWSAVRRAPTFALETPDGVVLAADPARHEPHALLRPLRSTATTIATRLVVGPRSSGGVILRRDADHSIAVLLTRAAEGDTVEAHLVHRHRGQERRQPLGSGLATEVLVAAIVDGLLLRIALDGGPPTTTDIRFLSTESAGGFGGVAFGPFLEPAVGASVLVRSWSEAPHRETSDSRE